MIIGTSAGNKKAISGSVMTSSGLKNILAIHVMTASGIKVDRFAEEIGTVSTFVGSGTAGDADGVGVLAELYSPRGIAMSSGFAYICDSLNHKIRKINLSTAEVTTFAGSGTKGGADGIGTLAQFNRPIGIAISSGFAYVCDSGHTIRKINLSTAEVTTFAGGTVGSSDGIGTLAQFNSPSGIDIESGFAYVVDRSNNKIRKINLSTAEVTTFAGSGTNGGADGIGVLATFRNPEGLGIDSGFAYIADSGNSKIRKINLSTAEVTTFAGSGTNGGADGIGTSASFWYPYDVSFHSGFAYVCDTYNRKIRKINLSTAEVTTFAGSGNGGSADGSGSQAEFSFPIGVAIDSGFSYVCDSTINKIRKIKLE